MYFSATGAGRRLVLPCVIAFLVGCVAFFIGQRIVTSLLSCNTRHDLVNPNLPCGGTSMQGEWDFEPLRDTLTNRKEELKAQGKVTHLSIYFRDLSPGPRFGIGEYDKFQPASLTKVPVMIALLHEADGDSSILEKTLTYTGSLNVNLNVETPAQTIRPNVPYTIRELIEKMIVYSDNYSYILLTRELNDESELPAYNTFRDLDVLTMMLAPRADFVSIQAYGNLFAILYNTGYLSKEMSQLALELLSRSTYKNGLAAGVPADVTVAHKFGLRTLEGGEIQLHDCGIVYHPGMEYVLCIMTSGTDESVQQSVIAELSRTVYDDVSARTQNR